MKLDFAYLMRQIYSISDALETYTVNEVGLILGGTGF